MGVYLKPTRQRMKKLSTLAFEQLGKERFRRQKKNEQALIELHEKTAVLAAKELGLSPVKNIETIRKFLNEQIICEVKSLKKKRKVRHVDIAAIAQTHRSRITAIMNRKLERVSIDCMVKVLDILGVTITVQRINS